MTEILNHQLHRLLWYVGRRGAFLSFLALIDVMVGLAVLRTEDAGLRLIQDHFYLPFAVIIPPWLWGVWWLGTGVLAAVAVAWKPLRPIGFALCAFIKAGLSLGFFVGWLNGLPGFTDGYVAGTILIAFALVALVVAGWRENTE